MLLVTISNLTKWFDETRIIENGTLSIVEGDKIGLVGRNGTGKTTLFNILLGKTRPDSGNIDYQRGMKIGAVAQELNDKLELSVYDFCFTAQPVINDIRLQMMKLEPLISSVDTVPPNEQVEEYQKLCAEYEVIGGYKMETEIRLVLEGIGFSKPQINQRLSTLSGGERNRAQIAAVLVGDYNLLLLDEPTNHLDIKSTIWLENHIASSRTACIIVSHDRRFLQNTVNKIAELSLGKLELFHHRYDQYLEEREKRSELAAHHFRHQAEEIARIEEFIRRNMAGQKTKQAQSKQKYLARMKKLENPKLEKEQQVFHIKDGGRSFRQVLKVTELAVGYNDRPLVEGIEFELNRGDRVGLVGPNGCGKTTLLKTLTGSLEPLGGTMTIGGNVEVAYFDQELSNINLAGDVISELWEIDRLAESGRLRSFLARFGFIGEDVFNKISTLSGGEKTKLSLAKLLYRPANLMVFDEPTNHLDISSIEALEEGLSNYNGSLLIVSHDRDFLDRTVNRIFEIDHSFLRIYMGNYTAYEEKKGFRQQSKKTVSDEKKLSYHQFKEKSRIRSRYKKRLQKIADLIIEYEERHLSLEKEEQAADASDWKRLSDLRDEKQALESEIIDLYLEKEEMEKEPPDDR